MLNEYEASPSVKSLSLKGGETVPNDVDSIYYQITNKRAHRLVCPLSFDKKTLIIL